MLRGRLQVLAEDGSGATVLQLPLGFARMLQAVGQLFVPGRLVAQQPVTVARLAQQQVDEAVVSGVAEIVGAVAAWRQQGGDGRLVGRTAEAVAQDPPVGIQPGQAVQCRQGLARAAEQGRDDAVIRHAGMRLQQVQRGLGFEGQTQVEAVGQFRTGVDAVLTAVGEDMPVLIEHLPEQQCQQQQNQNGQCALQRPAQGLT